MTENYQQILVRAFRALTEEERGNLLWHAENGTPICCGEKADMYFDGKGGA